jgi:hypothetical protein
MTYSVEAQDGHVGPVADFIVDDDDSWILRYVVVDTRQWLPGGKVLLSPDWIAQIQWDERKVHVDLRESEIKECPPYDPSHAVNREYEERLYDFYGRPRYWA